MGRKATEILLAIFNGSPAEKAIVIRGDLVVRRSSAALTS
jgi:DNA-binding LacI/PurR family transcriptional regulator